MYIRQTQLTDISQIMRYGFPGLTNVRARDDYVISYDARTRVPYWVCEHLTADRIAKNPEVDRAKCDFHEDLSIHEYFRCGSCAILDNRIH